MKQIPFNRLTAILVGSSRRRPGRFSSTLRAVPTAARASARLTIATSVTALAATVMAQLVVGSAAQATGSDYLPITRYVVAQGGTDRSGCIQQFPCASISYAASVSSPGDTIRVGPGVFSDMSPSRPQPAR